MTQKQIDPASEFGPTQAAPLAGNAQAAAVAAKSASVLETIAVAERISLRSLPSRRLKLLALAEAIEREDLVREGIGFNMKVWRAKTQGWRPDQMGHSCGTVACIAGWTALLDDPSVTGDNEIQERAKKILGLNSEESVRLFGALGAQYDLEDITAKHAVAVLRDFAESGEIRWRHFDYTGKRK